MIPSVFSLILLGCYFLSIFGKKNDPRKYDVYNDKLKIKIEINIYSSLTAKYYF